MDALTAANPTFNKDVEPILRRSCQECHRPGQVAPMSVLTYEDVRPWAKAIRKRILDGSMPPFHAAGPIGRFENDPRLTEDEIETVITWIDKGCRKGKPEDLAPPRVWESSWQIGEPDIILTPKKPVRIAANQDDIYRLVPLDHRFRHDTWIDAIELRPGNSSLVHHANLYMLEKGKDFDPDDVLDGKMLLDPKYSIYGWLPGSGPLFLPEGFALMIPKGARCGLEIHYTPPQEGEAIDRTTVALRFANGKIHRAFGGQIANHRTTELIPAGAANFAVTERRTIETDALVWQFTAHMHLRGKSFEILFHYPDGRVETVFELPRYYFNWQRNYRLKEPIPVPAGTVVEYSAVFDNSSANPLNPDPDRDVSWGMFSAMEMMSGAIQYEVDRTTPPVFLSGGKEVSNEHPGRSRREISVVAASAVALVISAIGLAIVARRLRGSKG